jgi:2-polyprenyl-6-methoxyphenol hydroxylase-like FAD-dependent oxidoreductase
MSQGHIIIIGGGIGGLAAAAALQKVGIDALVLEQAPQMEEVGAGLSLWSNAINALRQLPLDAPVLRLGSIINRLSTRTSQGRVLDVMDVQRSSQQAGAPSICISRGDL